jgi:hypothetical protein
MMKPRVTRPTAHARRTDTTWEDVIAIARDLPQVEVSTWYGTPGLKVAGKGFARLRTEAEGGLVLMCSLEEKERLLESREPAYYTTPHYDRYGSILVDLSKVSHDALRALIVRSWRIKATPRLRATLQAPGFAWAPGHERLSRPQSGKTRRKRGSAA